MALVPFTGDSITLGSINGTDTYVVGDASMSEVSTVLLHLDTTSAGTVSIVVKARPRGYGTATTPPFLPIAYLSLTDGGSVVAGNTYASAALTGDGDLVLVPASGMDIAADVTYTSGTHVLSARRLIGRAA